MRSVSLDLFAAAGHDWVAMVNHYSETLQHVHETSAFTLGIMVYRIRVATRDTV